MVENEIQIGEKRIRAGGPTYVIAEAGSNHNQSLETALRLIDVAAEAGVDAVKFQLFVAEELYPAGTEMHAIFKAIELSPSWLEKLMSHSKERGLHFLASAFDRKSVDSLAALNIPAYKIASSETANLPLLAYTAKKGRPMLVSTGMCDLVDVIEAVKICENAGNRQIALLQCGALYPLPPELANLRAMDLMRNVFGYPVGFSDHTLGVATSIAAAARGACIIEKHFTLDRKSKGPDHFYALEPSELKMMTTAIHEATAALGAPIKEMLQKERDLGRRDGLYAAQAIKRGSRITEADIAVKRPAVGLRARYKTSVLGTTAKVDLSAGAPLQWNQIEF